MHPIIAWIGFVWLVAASLGGPSDRVLGDALDVRLTSSKERYLLGEPVALTVTATNTSTETLSNLTVVVEDTEPQIQLLAAAGNTAFRPYLAGIFGLHNLESMRQRQIFAPGHSKAYRLIVLYACQTRSGLALPETGSYRLKALYPLVSVAGDRREIESNVIQITVESPLGKDAAVCDALGKLRAHRFLQGALVFPAEEQIPGALLDLLQEHPDSAYQAAIQDALTRYYRRRVSRMTVAQANRDPELQRIRSAVGLPLEKEEWEYLFPDDRRLDAFVSFHCPVRTPLRVLLSDVSQQSGVPLRLTPVEEFRRRWVLSLPCRMTLREFMYLESVDEGAWLVDPDGGYTLIPIARLRLSPSKSVTPAERQ